MLFLPDDAPSVPTGKLDAGSEAVPRSGFFLPARVRWGLFLGRAGRGVLLPLSSTGPTKSGPGPAVAGIFPTGALSAVFGRPGCAGRCF
jgi:hypothetical protein